MKIGETLKMISTDPGAVEDIKSLCNSLKQVKKTMKRIISLFLLFVKLP